MTTYQGPNLAPLAGIPSQGSDVINATPEGLITGDLPAVVTEDLIFAYSQNIPAWTPVGFNAAGELVPASAGAGAAARATGALTFSGTGTAADAITIGSVTYTLRAAPTTVANEVKIGATAAETAANLIAAINGDAGAGTLYGSLTVPHPDVTARADSSTVVGLVANVAGLAGNAIATTETGTNTSFGASTLTGGTAQSGVRAVGITVIPVLTPGSGTKKGAPVYRSGVFNPNMLNWPASFDTDAEKYDAFRGAPTPTNIIMRAPKTATVTLP